MKGNSSNIDYAIIVRNKTRLETLIERFNTKSQVKFYIESQGGNYHYYELEHKKFYESLKYLQLKTSKLIKNKVINREYLPSYIFSKNNLIIVIGQDGLVANTAKYSNNVPIVAVNPDLERNHGVLLPFNISNFIQGIEKVLQNEFNSKVVRFAEAKLNDGQKILAFNDIFIGVSSHASARYRISFDELSEEQSSSGMIISTQAGSSGWLSSVYNMAYGIARTYDKKLKHMTPKVKNNQLIFAVREPFKSPNTQIKIVSGRITAQKILIIESLMPADGVIFSDGVESDFLKFNSGTIAKVGLAKEHANIVNN